jgi:hypothetical protein
MEATRSETFGAGRQRAGNCPFLGARLWFSTREAALSKDLSVAQIGALLDR